MKFYWYTFYMEGGKDGWGCPWMALARNLDEAFLLAQREVRIYGFRCMRLRFIGSSKNKAMDK